MTSKEKTMAAILDEPILGLDFETTGVNAWIARPVQVSAAIIEPDGTVSREVTSIVDPGPGVEIAPDAAKVHGITPERIKAEGRPIAEVWLELLELLDDYRETGLPVCIYNVPYDWTLLLAESKRLALPKGRDIVETVPLADALLLDRAVNKYRKGKRNLEATAKFYKVDLTNAHDARADVLASVGIARKIAAKYPAISKLTVRGLHEAQRPWFEDWRRDRNAYFARVGKDRRQEGGWPIREVHDDLERAAQLVESYVDREPHTLDGHTMQDIARKIRELGT